MDVIALRLAAITRRMEAIASRLEVIDLRLAAITRRMEAIASRLDVIAIRLRLCWGVLRPLH